jgi:hypothetical protein
MNGTSARIQDCVSWVSFRGRYNHVSFLLCPFLVVLVLRHFSTFLWGIIRTSLFCAFQFAQFFFYFSFFFSVGSSEHLEMLRKSVCYIPFEYNNVQGCKHMNRRDYAVITAILTTPTLCDDGVDILPRCPLHWIRPYTFSWAAATIIKQLTFVVPDGPTLWTKAIDRNNHSRHGISCQRHNSMDHQSLVYHVCFLLFQKLKI